jgi:TolB protein
MNSDHPPQNNNHSSGLRVSPLLIGGILLGNLLLLGVLNWPQVGALVPALHTETPQPSATLTPLPTTTSTQTASPTPPPTATSPPTLTATPLEVGITPSSGTLILSLREGGDTHLFAYRPFLEGNANSLSALPLTRLTSGPQNDITPALSPDHSKLAFASNRNGSWDLYILDLQKQELTQFTDTSAYEAYPSWSPDGKWLAYEKYEDGNYEIILKDTARENGAINLTNHEAADHSPAWSPGGRKIGFISSRGGASAIWVADLDQSNVEDRFTRVSPGNSQQLKHPTWSPDDRYLTWAQISQNGQHDIHIWDSQKPDLPPAALVSGDWAIWDEKGEMIFTLVEQPLETYLTAHPVPGKTNLPVFLPAVQLPGSVEGFCWGNEVNLSGFDLTTAHLTPTPLWEAEQTSGPENGLNRYSVVDLEDIEAPYPQLHDLVNEGFSALRQKTAQKVGWDFLGVLENAFLPLTSHPKPGLENNWLYTGRGFSLSNVPYQAEWMMIVREDFGVQTYWRVYVKALKQNGQLGRPLKTHPWFFDPHHTSAQSYEKGGIQSQTIPAGYWVDFTDLALAYGWERIPALPNWGQAVHTARYQDYVFRDGRTWAEALLEIYPDEILATPTPDSVWTETP